MAATDRIPTEIHRLDLAAPPISELPMMPGSRPTEDIPRKNQNPIGVSPAT